MAFRRRARSAERDLIPRLNDNAGLKPAMKKREDSMIEYISYFKRVMVANNWNDENGGKIFPAMIPTGDPCLPAVMKLGQTTFSAIETELRGCQEPFREANLTMLMNIKKEHDVTVFDFKAKIVELVKAVYPTFEIKEQDQLCRDFFLHGLPVDLKEKALSVKPKTIEEVVNATLMAESIAMSSRSVLELEDKLNCNADQMVATIGNKNMFQRYKFKKPFSGRFRGSNRNVNSNPRHAEEKANVGRSVICFNCGGEGHFARLCPSPLKPWPTDFTQEN